MSEPFIPLCGILGRLKLRPPEKRGQGAKETPQGLPDKGHRDTKGAKAEMEGKELCRSSRWESEQAPLRPPDEDTALLVIAGER